MNDGWAALLFRPDEVPDDALVLGFALALAGYGVERPRLDVAALDALPGWSAAFYASGVRSPGHDELGHQRDLFTGEDLTPAIGVRLAARGHGAADVVVHTLVHGGAAGLDVGESLGEDDALEDDDLADGDDDDDEDEEADGGDAPPADASARLDALFGRPLVGVLTQALFHADRSLKPTLAATDPAAVAAVTARLVAVLRRVAGRGAKVPPPASGVAPPPTYAAFAAAYDFEDPDDPRDLYRELAIGRIQGTLRFLRAGEVTAARAAGAYPVAELLSSNLTEPKRLALLALDPDGVRLTLRDGKGALEAGPTFAELLRYLALGYATRTPLEEEIVAALMLRAAVRVS